VAALHRALVPQRLQPVPSTKAREVAAMLKAIHAGEDLVAARQQAVRVIEKLRGLRLTTAAELVETAVEETLAYNALPTMPSRRNTGGAFERTIRSSVFCARGVVGAFPGRAIGAQPRRGQSAPYRWHCLVAQPLSEHRAVEEPAHESRHHRLSQCWAPLTPIHLGSIQWGNVTGHSSEHVAHLADPGCRHMAEDIPVIMNMQRRH
jgi:hypothetical protein